MIDDAALNNRSGYQYPYYPNDPSKPMKIKDVSDGLSQSILLVEDADRPNFWIMGALQSDPTSAQHWANPNSWYFIHNVCYDYGVTSRMVNCYNSNEVYSFHPGGGLYAFGDGSAHFLSQDMDVEVFVSLFTRSFGDIVKDGSY
jgi:hypothetical protein